MRRWLAEPFLHFVVLGALTFGLHRLLQTQREHRLVVSDQAQREIAALFEQRQGRVPTDAERAALTQRWLEDELLFREGLRLDLLHTDSELRAEVIARVRSLLQASVPAAKPTEAELLQFYDRHRADYALPAMIGFREYLVRSGPDARDRARSLLQALKTLPADADVAELLHLPLSHPQGSRAELSVLYGPELVNELFALDLRVWHELRSARGIHLVKVEKRVAAKDPGLAAVRAQVLTDFSAASTARAFKLELARLEKQWSVDVEGPP
jgi:PPIC-type PPIASE domain